MAYLEVARLNSKMFMYNMPTRGVILPLAPEQDA